MDTIARIGGDEFVLLLQDVGEDAVVARKHASIVAFKVLSSLNEPYELPDTTYRTTPSIGVCLFLGETHTPADLLKNADTAMYVAKQKGRNNVWFYEDTAPDTPTRAA